MFTVILIYNTLKFGFFVEYLIDINEILAREKEPLRDENIELRKK